MAHEIRITFDTNGNARSLRNYEISVYKTDEPPHEMRQIGPVYNGIVSYRGVFATREAGLRAALAYLPNCVIVEVDSPTGGVAHAIKRPGWQRGRRLPDYGTFTILGGKTTAGMFVHSS